MENVEKQLLHITKTIEDQVDAAIVHLDNLDENEIEQLRKSRLKEIEERQEKKKEWLRNGHGNYDELKEEKCFFDTTKKSENVVVHFYRNSSERCLIVDKHLKILATKHIETKFTKLNAEKCPFLAERLKIKMIPTIVLIKKEILVDKIIGFSQLGNRDDFTTEVLEWRIAQNGLINYDGDLTTPPDEQRKTNKMKSSAKSIRDGVYNRIDDDVDLEEDGLRRDNLKSDCFKSDALSPELTAEELAELGLDD